ncbi:hypothetical protein F2Q70_00024998 [Brassica cretica]|uniref:Peptidase C1A papain C-terminal domain-containing protein n=1 Tax=Brassica cretica TaxID=69181 RepID=A0A8S9LEX4_BRACR|nr:hypothetical protein F2Q70_00024998 [Brassica cretica]
MESGPCEVKAAVRWCWIGTLARQSRVTLELFSRKIVIFLREKEEYQQCETLSKCLLKALAHQPLRVAIDAFAREFQFYSGDVFDGRCEVDLDHGVAAVGYGSSKGSDYIIVKNYWGPRCGEKERLHQGEEELWKTRGSQSIRWLLSPLKRSDDIILSYLHLIIIFITT